jgi:hypothetical protein
LTNKTLDIAGFICGSLCWEAAWTVAFNHVITTIVHEHAKSNRTCNIYSLDVLGFLLFFTILGPV